jgi:hypothetical protein
MLQEIIEPAWANAFEALLSRCALQRGDTVAVGRTRNDKPSS